MDPPQGIRFTLSHRNPSWEPAPHSAQRLIRSYSKPISCPPEFPSGLEGCRHSANGPHAGRERRPGEEQGGELFAPAARCSVTFESDDSGCVTRLGSRVGGRCREHAPGASTFMVPAVSPYLICKSFTWKQDVPAAVTKPGDGIASLELLLSSAEPGVDANRMATSRGDPPAPRGRWPRGRGLG